MDIEYLIESQNKTVEDLYKTIDCLQRARLRKIGILKWSPSAIWFKDAKQEHRLEIIDRAIFRLRNRVLKLTTDLISKV